MITKKAGLFTLSVTIIVVMMPQFLKAKNPWSVEEISYYQKKEVLKGKTFLYKEETVNGKTKKHWIIDCRPVSEQEYLDEILEAEKLLRREIREHEHISRDRERQLREQALVAGNKKLLQQTVALLENGLQRLENPYLQPYLVFDATTMPQDHFTLLRDDAMIQARTLLSSPENPNTLHDYTTLVATLEGKDEMLKELFYRSADNAIKRCDDTRSLKLLLELVS